MEILQRLSKARRMVREGKDVSALAELDKLDDELEKYIVYMEKHCTTWEPFNDYYRHFPRGPCENNFQCGGAYVCSLTNGLCNSKYTDMRCKDYTERYVTDKAVFDKVHYLQIKSPEIVKKFERWIAKEGHANTVKNFVAWLVTVEVKEQILERGGGKQDE